MRLGYDPVWWAILGALGFFIGWRLMHPRHPVVPSCDDCEDL